MQFTTDAASNDDLYVQREIIRLCENGLPDQAEGYVTTTTTTANTTNDDDDDDDDATAPPPQVSTITMNHILAGYVRVGKTNDAMSLLERMESPEENGLASPNVASYNTCLVGLPPQPSQNLLRDMIKMGMVNVSSFHTVLSNWGRAGELNRAVNVLNQMAQYASKTDQPSLAPDRTTFTMVLSLFAKRGMAREASLLLERMEHLQPDRVALSAVITAWANSGDPQAAPQALKLLERMKLESQHDPKLQPDVVAYNAVLAAMANTHNQGPQAETLLRLMQKHSNLQPTVVSYATVLSAWKNSPLVPEAVDRAEALLFEMVYQDDICPPNTVCFATVLSAMAKRGMAERATQLLERSQELVRSQRIDKIQPNAFVYASLLEGTLVFS